MADPSSSLFIPHIMGITLDTEGVAKTQVVATNRSTGESQIKDTDGNKIVIFDVSDPAFPAGYSANDVIEFVNVGSSVGGTTITISDALGGFQEVEIDCVASPTISVNL